LIGHSIVWVGHGAFGIPVGTLGLMDFIFILFFFLSKSPWHSILPGEGRFHSVDVFKLVRVLQWAWVFLYSVSVFFSSLGVFLIHCGRGF
jgi:hypothetical protein